MNKKLQTKIDQFLSETWYSDGGWAQVTDQDISDLREIIQLLIENKCQPDTDGDYPIEYALINRRKSFWAFTPIEIAYELEARNMLSIVLNITHNGMRLLENYFQNKLYEEKTTEST